MAQSKGRGCVKWHDASLNFYCGGGTRRDINGFKFLKFRIRTDSATRLQPFAQLTTWNAAGRCLVDVAGGRSGNSNQGC